MVFFIPWRVGAEESGAAKLLDLLGPPGWCSGCWPHDGDVAGGADSIFVIFRFGATLELGRSERTTMRPLLRPRWSYAVIAKVRHRKISAIGVCGVLSLRHFRLARWCSLSLGGWSPKTLARRSKQ
jgi:hypothetical protein